MNTLSLAVEQSPSCVAILTLDGRVEYANQRFTEVTQFTPDEILELGGYGLLGVDYDQQEDRKTWELLRSGGQWRDTVRHQRKDGTSYWAECFMTPVRDNTNQITCILAMHDDVTELRESIDKVTYQATHDLLTGLINRAEFEQRLHGMLASAPRKGHRHALCFIDLDQFKIVNDTNGHVAGDELLRQLGALLRQHIRQGDVLARIGGDEFAILFGRCDIAEALKKSERIRKLIAEHPFTWENRSYTIGMSAGLVEINAHSPNTTELLREADAACYTAKETGRNRVEVFSADEPTTARRASDMLWSTRLRAAINEDRLALFEQPIKSLQGAMLDSSEILVRMIDQAGELVSPGLFLPATERFDIAPHLDAWVVENTFDFLGKHPEFLKQRHYCAINLSGLSFNDEFAYKVNEWLEHYGLPAEKICFEITETAAMANFAKAIDFIRNLKEKGVLFALDDFGSGLSSFAYLKNLPVDILKIDGQFVREMLKNPIDEAMVKAINEIGKVMDKTMVAEFAETDLILKRLKDVGIDCAQGHAIAPPQPLIDTTQSAYA